MNLNMPWLSARKLPFHKKLLRLLHCMFSMMGHIVYLDYISDDLDWILKNAKDKD